MYEDSYCNTKQRVCRHPKSELTCKMRNLISFPADNRVGFLGVLCTEELERVATENPDEEPRYAQFKW